MRTYFGVHIYPVTRPTMWGARWEAYVGGRFVMADTLAGIKECIRIGLGKS